MASTHATAFQYVQETSEAFLALFPHRYDFIYAPHPNPKNKPEWQTESRYPLSDRQLTTGEYLYGVRFESETQYFLIDIDRQSTYHPAQDPLAIVRLCTALELIGITDHIACTSSDSRGIHLYFPISKAFNSWKLAKSVYVLLENAGFKLQPGQLELFPNVKTYSQDTTPSLFNAHRLPLQMGSYILGQDLEPVGSSQSHFVRLWSYCQRRNVVNKPHIKRLIKQAQQVSYRLSTKATKFLKDLNTEIEAGWTDYGQTNRLLGRITMRCFIFNHITEGGEHLSGQSLINKIVETATNLPGYKDWCRHQHEIESRAEEWARCVENSHYFPYGSPIGKYKATGIAKPKDTPNWNQLRSEETKQKIADAVQELEAKHELPEKPTARFKVLLEYGIGGASLYRYRELWHPAHQSKTQKSTELQKTDFGSACTEGASAPKNPTSLLSENDSNALNDKGFRDREKQPEDSEASNSLDPSKPIRDRIRQQLADSQKERSLPEQRWVNEAASAAQKQAMQRMREFLLSGEPILLAEVGQWLIKQCASVRAELILRGDRLVQSLLSDLAKASEFLATSSVSVWQFRAALEERYNKPTVIELTPDERRDWLIYLESTIGGASPSG